MAAAANKPGWPHYTAIAFFLTTVILGITTYVFSKDAATKTAEAAKARSEAQTASTLHRSAVEDITALQNAVGAVLEDAYDAQNPSNANTTVGLLMAKLVELGGEHRGPNTIDTLDKLRKALDTTIADRDSIKASLAETTAKLEGLRDQYQKTVDVNKDAKSKAEADLNNESSRFKEQITEKDEQFNTLQAQYNTTQGELQQERDSRDLERKKAADDIQKLIANIERLRRELLNTTRTSFEKPQGQIVNVDSTTRLVWINLGERDFIREGITFSVYAKDVAGVQRGPQDVKGKIRVTRILNQNTAEASILNDDFTRPITQGDLIHTPLWMPGRTEIFSIVGLIDLDQDGRSDREALHQILATHNARFDNEINDKGQPINESGEILSEEEQGTISESTKFLIIGEIPDETELPNEDDKIAARAINKQLRRLQNEAIINGVDIINLNEFLSFIGYHPSKRLYKPGQSKPYNLESGKIQRQKVSTGTVSDSVNPNRPSKQKVSTGNTSGLFNGGRQP